MQAHGEKMTRQMAGLYLGNDIRAEKSPHGHWDFDMKCDPIAKDSLWYEPKPDGLWTSIGAWPTLDEGMRVASLMRSGTHFYDSSRHTCRRYDEEVYSTLRKIGEAS